MEKVIIDSENPGFIPNYLIILIIPAKSNSGTKIEKASFLIPKINMMSKKVFLLILFLIISLSSLKAQRYGTALGLRFGNNSLGRTFGISAQQRITERLTFEAIAQSDFSRNSTLSFLLEKHHPIISKRFNYYYGAGISFGKEESFEKVESSKQIIQTYGNATTGVDLIGGIEMTLLNTVISLDYKPNINIAGREDFYRGQVGISARMVLVKSKEQKKKQRQREKAKRARQKTNSPLKLDSIFKKK